MKTEYILVVVVVDHHAIFDHRCFQVAVGRLTKGGRKQANMLANMLVEKSGQHVGTVCFGVFFVQLQSANIS